MFVKIINNAIESYPYSPHVDYPLTSFPVGDSYPEFNCYWVYPTAPDNPDAELYDAVESTPIFNGEHWEQSWEFVEKPPVAPSPDWDGFNLILFTDSVFVGYGLAAASVNPWIVPAVTESYGKFAKKGLASGFGNYWTAFCQSLGVQQSHRDYWAGLAESFNLSADFVAIVRGSMP